MISQFVLSLFSAKKELVHTTTTLVLSEAKPSVLLHHLTQYSPKLHNGDQWWRRCVLHLAKLDHASELISQDVAIGLIANSQFLESGSLSVHPIEEDDRLAGRVPLL